MNYLDEKSYEQLEKVKKDIRDIEEYVTLSHRFGSKQSIQDARDKQQSLRNEFDSIIHGLRDEYSIAVENVLKSPDWKEMNVKPVYMRRGYINRSMFRCKFISNNQEQVLAKVEELMKPLQVYFPFGVTMSSDVGCVMFTMFTHKVEIFWQADDCYPNMIELH